MTKQWYEAICIADEEQASLISHVFQAMGTLSVTFTDGSKNKSDSRFAHEANHAEQLWPQTKVTALFDDLAQCEYAVKEVKILVPKCPTILFQVLDEKNWVHEGQKNFPTKSYGEQQLWIFPSWDEDHIHCTKPYFRLDPGLAFGTGTHPTTHLCLEWIATHQLEQKAIFDFGCGSGILALAALAKGAAFVDAIDHDKQAIIASKSNLQLNTQLADDQIKISLNWPTDKSFDVILANVLANPLIEFAPKLIAALNPGATLVLSGILKEEQQSILAAYTELQLIEVSELDGWLLIELQQTA